jgi:hypothetical protein
MRWSSLIARLDTWLSPQQLASCLPKHIIAYHHLTAAHPCPQALSTRDWFGMTPLYFVCERGLLTCDVIEKLIDACSESIEIGSGNGYLSIHNACKHGSPGASLIRLLLDRFPEVVFRQKTLLGCLAETTIAPWLREISSIDSGRG